MISNPALGSFGVQFDSLPAWPCGPKYRSTNPSVPMQEKSHNPRVRSAHHFFPLVMCTCSTARNRNTKSKISPLHQLPTILTTGCGSQELFITSSLGPYSVPTRSTRILRFRNVLFFIGWYLDFDYWPRRKTLYPCLLSCVWLLAFRCFYGSLAR